MAINDFSALIGMAATISIAFVATEYVTSYTKNLCERFFMFQEYIKNSFGRCRKILTDRETLKFLHPSIVDGKSTNGKIEEARRKNELINKEIDELEKSQIDRVVDMCQARSMSSVCLFIFMFDVGLLLLGSIEPKLGVELTQKYLSTFGILSMFYILCVWCLGEFEYNCRWLHFSSLRHAVYSFVIIVVLTLLSSHFFSCPIIDEISVAWWWILLFSVLFSYLNFCIFVFRIKLKVRTFKNDLESSIKELEQRCKVIEEKTQELMTVSKVSADLKSNPFETLN